VWDEKRVDFFKAKKRRGLYNQSDVRIVQAPVNFNVVLPIPCARKRDGPVLLGVMRELARKRLGGSLGPPNKVMVLVVPAVDEIGLLRTSQASS